MSLASEKERMIVLTRQLLSQGKSADEIRVELSKINPILLQELNAIPRQTIRQFIVEIIERYLPAEPFLDLGCGYRSNKPEVAQGLGFLPKQYFGIDHVTLFKKPKELGEGPNIQGDAMTIPLRSGSVGTVLCTEFLEHVPDDRQVISEILRVASPHALLIVTVPGKDIPRHETPPYQIDRRRFTTGSLAELISTKGFQILELRAVESFGFETNIFAVAKKEQP